MNMRTTTGLVLVVFGLAACDRTAAPAAVADEAAPAVTAAAPAAGSGSAAEGSYECWANGSANLLLNFTVTGPGTYTASDGSTGTFAIADDGAVTFTGYQAEVLPSHFSVVYHTPGGQPTFSYRARGGEAAFCEHVG